MYEAADIPDINGEDIDPRNNINWISGTPTEEMPTEDPDVPSVKLVTGQFDNEELQYYRDSGYLVVREPWGYSIYNE